MEGLTAQAIAQAAEEDDPLAREVYACSGRQLGGALALLVDLLNPEAMVIGSIYARSGGTPLWRCSNGRASPSPGRPAGSCPPPSGSISGMWRPSAWRRCPPPARGTGRLTKVCFDE